MLWSDQVLEENSRDMKRLWLAGTIVAGLAANPKYALDIGMVASAVNMADAVLVELDKNNPWEKTK